MFDAQGGLCAICHAAPAAHVDHDHETGAVPALLCFSCNGGLGQFKDDPYLLHAAAYSVELHTARPPNRSRPSWRRLDPARSRPPGRESRR
jgi:hypothetical protein